MSAIKACSIQCKRRCGGALSVKGDERGPLSEWGWKKVPAAFTNTIRAALRLFLPIISFASVYERNFRLELLPFLRIRVEAFSDYVSYHR